jgi:hypothetical protein
MIVRGARPTLAQVCEQLISDKRLRRGELALRTKSRRSADHIPRLKSP